MDKVNKKTAQSNFTTIVKEYAFIKGMGEVKHKDVGACKAELMAALKITTEPSFTRRKRGQVVPTIEEYMAITRVFSKYGVTEPFGA